MDRLVNWCNLIIKKQKGLKRCHYSGGNDNICHNICVNTPRNHC